MPKKRIYRSLATSLLVALCICLAASLLWTQAVPDPSLEIRRLQPTESDLAVVDATSYERVEFVYEVTNSTTETLVGLRTSLGCSCQITREPPKSIAPGQTAIIGFTVRAPYAGSTERSIALLASNVNAPLLTFPIRLHVDLNPPAFVREPRDAELVFIAGESTDRKLSFETIESAGSENWLANLETNPPDLLIVGEPHVVERPSQDIRIVKRVYTFSVASPSTDCGTETGLYQLRARDESSATSSHMIERRTVPRFSYFPQHVKMSRDSDFRKLTFVDRLGKASFSVADYDNQLFDISQSETTNVFEIKLKSPPPEGAEESLIRFNAGDSLTLPVSIKFK